MLNKFESWARKTYKPKEAPWKRKILFLLSAFILLFTIILAYMQINYQWTNDGVWIVIIPFHILSLLGLYISIFKKDFWVALFLGNI